jgi:flavin-binding protein dodecin
MPNKTYKVIEIVGLSDDSVQQAIRNALAKASETLRNIDWFEVTTIRGSVKNNKEPEFQVVMKVGFRLEGSPVN